MQDLSAVDRERFDRGLKMVFVDNYAAVPSESIRRLLALLDAGVLSALALGDNYDLDRKPDRTVIRAKGATHIFDVFIDARGQQPLKNMDLPFPSLRRALLGAGQDIPVVDENYTLIEVPDYAGRRSIAEIPCLMHDRPFVQGITASFEISAVIAEGMAAQRPHRRVRRSHFSKGSECRTHVRSGFRSCPPTVHVAQRGGMWGQRRQLSTCSD